MHVEVEPTGRQSTQGLAPCGSRDVLEPAVHREWFDMEPPLHKIVGITERSVQVHQTGRRQVF